MNTAVMFSRASDEWETPQDFFDRLNSEFQFDLDAAATSANAKCPVWYGDRIDALKLKAWATSPSTVFLNPPYSQCYAFMEKAVEQSLLGHTVVCLVPARTDTRWWHYWVYYGDGMWYPGVEVRFIKGRLKFGGSANSAPFPSVVVIFRPPQLDIRSQGQGNSSQLVERRCEPAGEWPPWIWGGGGAGWRGTSQTLARVAERLLI